MVVSVARVQNESFTRSGRLKDDTALSWSCAAASLRKSRKIFAVAENVHQSRCRAPFPWPKLTDGQARSNPTVKLM